METGADTHSKHAEVLSIVSHDIRAPLGVILAAVSELLDPRVGPLNDQQRTLLQLVRRSGERLTRLAANVHFLKRACGGALTLSRAPVDVRDVARRAIDSFERSGELGKKVHAVLQVSAERAGADVDAELVTQALTNVLANAIRVARAEIVVTVAADERACTLVVDDDGPGIPPHLQSMLLASAPVEPGVPDEVAPPAKETAARGLGLRIVREIVAAHAGSVTAETRFDTANRPLGARIRIALPLGSQALL